MVDVTTWSETPASNTTVDGVSIAEACSPANINNAIRSVMGGVKTYTLTVAATYAPLSGATLTSATLTSATLTAPTLSGAIYNNGSARGNITAVAALEVDCSLGNFFTKTIAGNSTFTFANAPASRSYGFSLKVVHTSGTITWPAAVVWPSSSAPTLTTGKTHLFMFHTDDGGTTWRGSSLIDYSA